MISDQNLMRQYATQGDEASFAEVVRRHMDFVYSVAQRVTRNGTLSEDVAQGTFTQLARQAARLCHYNTLVGWLHSTTRYIAIDLIRGEVRRRIREEEASFMQNDATTSILHWETISPLLDEAVGELREEERKVVLLRYFQNLSHREIGAMLNLSENSANKRVERALEKLRGHFSRRGVKASSGLLATAIAENSVQAAPMGLAVNVANAAIAGASSTTSSFLVKILIMSTTAKITTATAIVIIVATITWSWPHPVQPANAAQTSPAATGVSTAADLNKPLFSSQVEKPIAPAANTASAPNTSQSSDTETVVAPVAPPPPVVAPEPEQFTAGPQTDLNTAIATAIHFIESNDTLSFLQTVMPPEALASETNGQTLQDVVDHANNDGNSAKRMDAMLAALHVIGDNQLTPQLSNDGNRATFSLDPPIDGHKVIIFNNVGGFWYLDGM
jgi:RNA polymerase sigma factor (sigma-70 family)